MRKSTTAVQGYTAGQGYNQVGASAEVAVRDALEVCDQWYDPNAEDTVKDALEACDQRYDSRYIADTGGLIAALGDLQHTEAVALQAQRDSPWLVPAWVWSTGLAPVLVLLLLMIATGRVTIRHFRRPPSALLSWALLGTASVAVTAAAFGTSDEAHLSATPWASYPATVIISLALLLACGVLAYLSYRPRLAEYRFEARRLT